MYESAFPFHLHYIVFHIKLPRNSLVVGELWYGQNHFTVEVPT